MNVEKFSAGLANPKEANQQELKSEKRLNKTIPNCIASLQLEKGNGSGTHAWNQTSLLKCLAVVFTMIK